MNNDELERFILGGRTFDEVTRIPTLEEIERRVWKTLHTKRPLLSLGVGTDGDFWITEEERENHLHILGSTGEGKTRLEELLMRHDVDRINPFFFGDNSTSGAGALRMLKYCAKKGVKKVIYYDPAHLFSRQKVLGLNPFVYHPSLEDACVANVADTIRVIFNTKDEADTPMILKYLPAILHVLFKANATLYEALYFSERDNPVFQAKRHEIFERSPKYDRYRSALIDAYNPHHKALATESTIRRFEPLFNDIVALSLAMTGIDFMQVVREGYTIIANLGSFHLQPIHRKLMGTLFINGIDFAVDRLRAGGWKGVYYMYIDEAQEFATRKVGDILARKRQNGLRLNLAHHHLGQLEDKRLLNDVVNLTKTKIAFYIPDADERMKIVKAFYGGALADRDVHYVLGQQKKQFCVVKKGKEPAAIIRVHDVPEVEADVDAYLDEIYRQPFYFSPKEIRHAINARLPLTERSRAFLADRTAQSVNRPASKTHGREPQNREQVPDQTPQGEGGGGQAVRGVEELFVAAEERQRAATRQTPPRADGDKPVRKPKTKR
jgi:hypothetical protein